MNENNEDKYGFYSKVVWAIYTVIIAIIIVILFTVVAQDTEERIFYTLMGAASAYVFRPTDKMIGKAVFKLFGAKRPSETADADNE